jgi:hypothetical protein
MRQPFGTPTVTEMTMKMSLSAALCTAALLHPVSLPAQSRAERDQLLLARFAQSTPCPQRVPDAWLRPDSTLGRSRYCPVVAAASEALATSPDSLHRWIVAHASCTVFVDLVVSEPPDTTTRSAWNVTFVADTARMALVHVDRESGEVSIRRAFFGVSSRLRKPPCRPTA